MASRIPANWLIYAWVHMPPGARPVVICVTSLGGLRGLVVRPSSFAWVLFLAVLV